MSESDDENVAGLSLEGLAHELESLRGLQRIVVVPKERVVGRFTGDSRQLSVRDFQEQVRAAWVAQVSEKEDDKLWFLWSHLSIAVKEELQCHPAESRDTTEGTFSILQEVYGDRRTICHLLTTFNGILQRPGEGVHQYANRLNKSFPDLTSKQKQERQEPLGDKVLRDHFLARLSDDLLGRQLRERAFQNPDLTFFAVREEAIRWRADDEEATSAIPIQAAAATAAPTRDLEELFKQLEGLRSELAAMKNQMTRQHPEPSRMRWEFTKDGRPICIRCRKAGHIGRNCPAGNANPPR